MGHVPSLCVFCSPCYSRWCYGQILAIVTVTTINVWERIGEKHLAQLVGEGACRVGDLFHYIFIGYRATHHKAYNTPMARSG